MIYNLMSKSRTTEVASASMRMIGAFENTTLNIDPHLEGMFSGLQPKTGDLITAINRSKTLSELETKDEVRDDKLRALFYLVTGFTHHPDAETRDSAVLVKAVLDNYGDITGDSYSTESALIVSILNDLSQPEMQAAIAVLSGCGQVIEDLQAAQTDFENTRIAYEQDKAEESTQLNATTIKKEVLGIINNKIVVYLRAMETVDVETYGAFARTISEIIDENNEVVKKRHKKPVENPAE